MKQVLHPRLSQIEWMRHAIPCEYNQAVRLLLLYGFLEYVFEGDGGSVFKQAVYADKTGQSRTTVRQDLVLLSKRGWISVTTAHSGTDIEIHGIPFAEVCTQGVQWTVGVRTQGVQTDGLGESIGMDCGSPISKKAVNNTPYGVEEAPSASRNTKKKEQQQELIQQWNAWKPKSWTKLKGISPSRERSIRALGGYREVIDLIPAFMAGAKANKFWISKEISFENVIGTGVTPKGHFHELAERGSSANTNTAPGTLAQPPEHPDFFPPLDEFTELRPKVNNFIDDDDRDRREVEAREFYAKQLEAGT